MEEADDSYTMLSNSRYTCRWRLVLGLIERFCFYVEEKDKTSTLVSNLAA
jgi:hypothetical protein